MSGVLAGLLALDFDGVMHPVGASVDGYFCRLPLLEEWLRLRPGIDVVVSSSWREQHALEEMVSHFSEDLRPRIVGATPIIKRDGWEQFDGEPPPVRFDREAEVLRWLRASGSPWRAWAALDDQAWRFKPFNPRVVLCNGKVGLTMQALAQLDAVFAAGQ